MTQFDIDSLKKQAADLIQKFEKFEKSFESEFELHKETSEVKIHKKESKGEPIIIRGQLKLDHPPKIIFDFLHNGSLDDLKKFNIETVSRTPIHKFDEHSGISKQRYTTGVFMVSDREFCAYSAWMPVDDKNNSWYLVNVPVDGVEISSGCVRAANIFGIMKFTELDGGKSELINYSQLSLGGWLPQYLIDQSVMSAPSNMLRLNTCIKK